MNQVRKTFMKIHSLLDNKLLATKSTWKSHQNAIKFFASAQPIKLLYRHPPYTYFRLEIHSSPFYAPANRNNKSSHRIGMHFYELKWDFLRSIYVYKSGFCFSGEILQFFRRCSSHTHMTAEPKLLFFSGGTMFCRRQTIFQSNANNIEN
jgi:hypothetical protein